MKGLWMISGIGKQMKYLICTLAIIFLFSNCTHKVPRLNSKGEQQTEYTYQLPEKIDGDWEISSLEKEAVESARIVKLIKNILAGKFPNTHSVLLVKNGKLILEEYFYGNKRDDLHYLASATKSITSILIGISLDQDFLTGVDQNASHWFNDYQNTNWISQPYNITIRHLLSMTAGIDWDEKRSASDPKHDYFAMRRGGDWIRYVFNKDLVAPPGQQFNYNGGLSALLGEIIKRASWIDAEKFSEKYLFEPLGISDYSWLKYNNGSINTGGGLLLRSRDMAKIGQVVLNNGMFKNKRIVSKKWIYESTKNHTLKWAHPFGSGYGYQWWLGERIINGEKIRVVIAKGRGGQCIFVIPKANAIAVVTSQLRDNPGGYFRPQFMMTEYIIPALFPQASPKKNLAVDSVLLKKYVGKYEDRWFHLKASITIKDKKLIMVPHSWGGEMELFPTSETTFYGNLENIGNVEVNFSNDDNGSVDGMTMRIGFTHMLFDKIK